MPSSRLCRAVIGASDSIPKSIRGQTKVKVISDPTSRWAPLLRRQAEALPRGGGTIILMGLRFVLLCILVAGSVLAQTADLAVTHARIYTVNPRQPRASAIAVRAGKIL